MSEYTTCNYCKLQSIRRDAKNKGKRVVRIPSMKMEQLGGEEIHVLGKGEKVSQKNWVCWFMAITDSCVC